MLACCVDRYFGHVFLLRAPGAPVIAVTAHHVAEGAPLGTTTAELRLRSLDDSTVRVHLGRGRLLADTPMRDFIRARVQPRVRIRTTEGEALVGLLKRHGHEAAESEDGRWTVHHAHVEDIGRLVSGAGLPILELAAEEGTLEQAYLDLTASEAEFTATTTETPSAPARPAHSQEV